MEKEKALELWDAIYGKNNLWQLDCFGIWMYRDDYGDTEKKRVRPNGDGKLHTYGWEIDHIRPKDSYSLELDADFYNNYEPMHWENNREKSNNYPHFFIGDKQYRVVRCNVCYSCGFRGYGIINESGKRVDWKGVQERYFRTNK